MENKQNNKKLLGILIPVAIVALIVILAVFFIGKEDGYRLIRVHEVNGEALIERPEVGSMDAYENLNLISGDKVTTMLKSYTRLRLDDDKYLLAEEDSIIELVATGDATKSKTGINLLQGAVTIEIQNKLNADSTFEVTTPNAVMAIRGTVFRVKISKDENGNDVTKVSIFEGAVGVQKKYEDGMLGEETLVEESQEAIIHIDDAQELQIQIGEVDLSDIPLEVWEFLKEIAEERRELTISLDEIKEAIKRASENESAENDTESEEKEYTVTFTYKGNVFGTQTVKDGELASKPKLIPAPSGTWDFDFSTPITEDVEIEFIE